MPAATPDVVIYHNPACATSRKVLGMIRAAGVAPRVVEYLKTPPDRTVLLDLLRRTGLTPRQLLRRRGTPYDALGLGDPAVTDVAIVDAILAHPILMERPVVAGPGGVRLCRPVERVHEVLAAR